MNTQINTYDQEDLKKYSSLKKSINKERTLALKKRLKSKPSMNDIEYLLGAFLEMYEPYLKEIVLKLVEKGYAIETSSGFGQHNGEYQSLDGYFSVDYVTRNKLEKNGIKVRENSGFKSLVFWPEKIDLSFIKEKWLKIVSILPDKGLLTQPSMSPQAVKYRRKYASSNPTLQRERFFERLEYKVQQTMINDIKRRKEKNPKPDKIESQLGLFVEELEPQVRKAVLDMNKKGYSTDASGFMENPGDQMIEGDFQLEEKTIKDIQSIGVTVETNPSGYTRLQFSPKEADITKIKKQWNKIVSLLPDKKKIADSSMTVKAREFRKNY